MTSLNESNSIEKAQVAHNDLEPAVTYAPLPGTLKTDGGLVLGAEGLKATGDIRFAKDGRSIVWNMSLNDVNRPTGFVTLILGLCGLIWVPMSSYWGRAPVIFWTSIIGFAFTLGTPLCKEYSDFFVIRCFGAAFLTGAQTVSLAFLKDMFYFHERARKIGLWACLYICSPYIGPMLGNFVVGKTHKWQDPYWMCVGVAGLQLILNFLFIDETWFNRKVPTASQPARPQTFQGRMFRLTGIWQLQNHSYFSTFLDTYKSLVYIILQPHFGLMALSYFLVFCWIIGINITTSVIFATPVEYGGYGYTNVSLGYLHFSPIVGVVIAEILGHFLNDFIARRYVAKHGGVFEPEVRLWPVYIGAVFNIPGLVLVGQTVANHWNVAGAVFGWGLFGFGIMLGSVVITAYCLDCFPTAPAEVAAWLNLSRTIGGFAVGYFQEPWGKKSGYDVSFGVQAVICAISVIPVAIVHIYGHRMRLNTEAKSKIF
ncbi:MFS general substrate transporter [Plenodomus tracheiphilus IPT5]|uniref:MFS general substrate transporter n=1 Tax=Plenodomus tracheiphilus IPT5 TaxID=1408161 RepID=A0A6A7BBZ3_9PLEO|nr:MFS general substrate transporter [Plenodomus tracheiphilus IPT5]